MRIEYDKALIAAADELRSLHESIRAGESFSQDRFSKIERQVTGVIAAMKLDGVIDPLPSAREILLSLSEAISSGVDVKPDWLQKLETVLRAREAKPFIGTIRLKGF